TNSSPVSMSSTTKRCLAPRENCAAHLPSDPDCIKSHDDPGRSARGGPYHFRVIPTDRRPSVAQPLMPHATASWLVDNTALSFVQIAEFCGLHILEVQAIADDTAG